MFRVNPVTDGSTSLGINLGMLGVIIVATAINAWLVIEVRKEQRAIAEIVRGGFSDDIQRLGSLPGELRWQFVSSVVVFLVLISAAATIVFATRANVKSQASLRTVKLLAGDILASMDQAVVTTDLNGDITGLNPRACELLRVTADYIGKALHEACAEGQVLRDLACRVHEAASPIHEYELRMDRGGVQPCLRVDCHLLRGMDQRVSGTVLHIRDVTDRVLLEAQMKRMERFMGLGSLVAGLHHEIKNPLGALSLHVQLIEERLVDSVDTELAEMIGVLKTEVTRISGVLETFRDYASLQTLNRTETDVERLVAQTAGLMRPKARAQGVEIRVVPPELPVPVISADATRIEQVLLNLVINALEQMPDGGKLTLALGSDAETLTVHVTDTGPGISDNIRNRVFDPYFTTRNEGMGMGLAVCDKIIQQHGGALNFDTSCCGTTFHISLPNSPPPLTLQKQPRETNECS